MREYAGRIKHRLSHTSFTNNTSLFPPQSHHTQAADSVEVARAAPFVEKLVADGYEVLYLTEAIDEAMVTNLAKFGDYELVDVSKEGVSTGDEEAEKKVGCGV